MSNAPEILRKGTIRCPNKLCGELLKFKTFHGVRIAINNTYEARCPKENIYFRVEANKESYNKRVHKDNDINYYL